MSILIKLIEDNNINYFIDIGSNNGIYSFYLASQFNNLKILAFEPNNEAFRKFNKTLETDLELFKNIKIFNCGLSDTKSKSDWQEELPNRSLKETRRNHSLSLVTLNAEQMHDLADKYNCQ